MEISLLKRAIAQNLAAGGDGRAGGGGAWSSDTRDASQATACTDLAGRLCGSKVRRVGSLGGVMMEVNLGCNVELKTEVSLRRNAVRLPGRLRWVGGGVGTAGGSWKALRASYDTAAACAPIVSLMQDTALAWVASASLVAVSAAGLRYAKRPLSKMLLWLAGVGSGSALVAFVAVFLQQDSTQHAADGWQQLSVG